MNRPMMFWLLLIISALTVVSLYVGMQELEHARLYYIGGNRILLHHAMRGTVALLLIVGWIFFIVHSFRSKYRARLLESQKLYQAIFENSDDAIICIDTNKIVIDWNPASFKIYGYTRDEVIGKEIPIIPEKHNDLDDILSQIKSGTPVIDYETVRQKKDGKQVLIRLTAFPIRNVSKDIQQIISFASDITEKKKLETQIIQTDKMASIGRMSSSLAHEINTPLSSILLLSQILGKNLKNRLNDKELSDIQQIGNQTRRCTDIIKNLLNYVHIPQCEKNKIGICQVIDNGLNLLNNEILKKKIILLKEYCQGECYVMGDANQLQQVIINITHNAIDAVNVGGEIRVETFLSGDGRNVITRIIDNGTGIPGKNQDEIFLPYFTTKEVGKGTGLGLSICRQIIDSHNGSIDFESSEDGGTTFSITLPGAKS